MRFSKTIQYKISTTKRFFLLCSVMVLLFACERKPKKQLPLNGYNLAEPEKFFMPDNLLEVSGITFYKGRNDTVYAVQDESGKVFRLAWGIKKPTNTRFANNGDYEDLAILNATVYVLKSNGNLYVFPFAELNLKEPVLIQELSSILPLGEYEGMFGDEENKHLYILCKKCEQDNNQTVTLYELRTGANLSVTRQLQVDVTKSNSFQKKLKNDFKPSAIAKHPQTGEWYILSAVNKLLLVTDSTMNIKSGIELKASLFPQPEGIAFDNEGNLYISNEGTEINAGNILKFRQTKGAKK
jgi:SdiA-regulated